jgi:hypothetical protein
MPRFDRRPATEHKSILQEKAFYSTLVMELMEYINLNGDEEHLIEHLLISKFSVDELVNYLGFEKEKVISIAKLHGLWQE